MKTKIQTILLPVLIIAVASLVGANMLLGQQIQQDPISTGAQNTQNLRLLSLKAPGMFCIGCSASIEGYLGAIEGVQSVNASLATKKVDVVYDPTVVSKDTILANQILGSYGKELLSDEPFTGNTQAQTPSTTRLPQQLAFKLQEAAAKVAELENQQDYQSTFDLIDQAIVEQNYQQAEVLLDELLSEL